MPFFILSDVSNPSCDLLVPEVTTLAIHVAQNKKATQFKAYKDRDTKATA